MSVSLVPFSRLAKAYGRHSKYTERWLIARGLHKPELAVGQVPKGGRRGAIEKATYRITDMEWGDGPEAWPRSNPCQNHDAKWRGLGRHKPVDW